jgi:hypothetical protein
MESLARERFVTAEPKAGNGPHAEAPTVIR